MGTHGFGRPVARGRSPAKWVHEVGGEPRELAEVVPPGLPIVEVRGPTQPLRPSSIVDRPGAKR